MQSGQGPATFASPPATFKITWTPSGVIDDTNYYTGIYLDQGSGFVQIDRTTTGASQYFWQVEDKVVNGPSGQTYESFTFKVSTVERATGTQVSSTTATTLGPMYIGWCSWLR